MANDPSTPPPPWIQGDPIGASRLNAGEQFSIRSIQVAQGSGLTIMRSGSNVVIGIAPDSPLRLVNVPLKITSAVADADGFFNLKRYFPPMLPDKSGPIAESDLGRAATTEDAIGITVPALGNDFALGTHVSYDAYSEGGKQIYAVQLANTVEVDLSSPAGSAGVDAVSACSRTYTCKIAGTDITVGAGISPIAPGWRAFNLELAVGATGRGCFIGGSFQLRVADEVPANAKVCT